MSQHAVTDEDREKAVAVVEQITGVPWDVFSAAEFGWVDHVAAALAEGRQKARAPFIEVVSRLRGLSLSSGQAAQVAYEHAAVMVDAAGQDRS